MEIVFEVEGQRPARFMTFRVSCEEVARRWQALDTVEITDPSGLVGNFEVISALGKVADRWHFLVRPVRKEIACQG